MSEEKNRSMTLLDEMVSGDSLQLLKAALPYVPAKSRQLLSVYAKSLELQNTLTLFRESSGMLSVCETAEEPEPLQFLSEIRRFLSPAARQQIDGLLETLSAVQMFDLFREPQS